jgi:hypothetical protein
MIAGIVRFVKSFPESRCTAASKVPRFRADLFSIAQTRKTYRVIYSEEEASWPQGNSRVAAF